MRLSTPKERDTHALTKAVFVDKDGTLIPNLPYNANPAYVSLEPGAGSGLRLLAAEGYLPVIVSNQSGIAQGFFTEEALAGVHGKINELLLGDGVSVEHFYFCPHHPAGVVKKYVQTCGCRKPKPGLLLEAANDLNIDLSQSWMIGDILHDVEAGNNAGCQSILIDAGNETEWDITGNRRPVFIASDLDEAARFIVQHIPIVCPEKLQTI